MLRDFYLNKKTEEKEKWIKATSSTQISKWLIKSKIFLPITWSIKGEINLFWAMEIWGCVTTA